MNERCGMSKNRTVWAKRVFVFCECFSTSWVNVRSSWRGSRLNVHTIPMKHRLSQLPGRRMRLLQNSVQSADFCNYQRYNGAYQDLYRKSRIRAARKKRRTMDDDLRIPYFSSERTMKGRGKRHSKKNSRMWYRTTGWSVCAWVSEWYGQVLVARSGSLLYRQQAGFLACGSSRKDVFPDVRSSDNSVLHFPLTVTRSYRICTCFPFDFGRKKVPSSAPAVIFSFYKYSIWQKRVQYERKMRQRTQYILSFFKVANRERIHV